MDTINGMGVIKHFRVDKMRNICTLDEKRQGEKVFDKFNVASYAKSNFGMYGGTLTKVEISFRNDLVGVVIDRFGKDIIIVPTENNRFITTVEVAISNQFLGWIFALGSGAKILRPESVVNKLKESIMELQEFYETDNGISKGTL